MQCPECQFDNPDGVKFCGECGNDLRLTCIHCNSLNPPGFRFCGECGCELSVTPTIKLSNRENVAEIIKAEDHADDATCSAPDSERKCVTVMFSDLAGYTEMSEKLDPEEVKKITSAIFSALSKIIKKYDGFIEKYIGDAILAVFGAVEAFEDSALRAIKAAREIHAHVESISPKYEKLIGRSLTMHTGINTGVVVTGEINFEKGTHGLVGDTINTAARLMSASKSGDIIIDHDSFVQTKGYFEHEPLNPVKVKGKASLIQVYRVGKALREPQKLHRLHGLRAELIGRSIEMQILRDAAENLEQGHGSVVSVCGTAGTGKSRLVHEFKKTLSLEKIRWFDANAYPYTQNTPYYPLVDLLTKAFGIEESDSSEAIKRKVESSLEGLLGKESKKAPYIGGLFSIEYSETNTVSPEYWKDQLYFAVDDVVKALAKSGPTVICLEDMHWADPSTMELVRKLVSNLSGSIMVICIYRPVITIFTDFEIKTLPIDYTELRLRELSPSESQDIVCSLLNADQVPKELRAFIRDSIDGNPFYIEELINALIDSEALSKISGQWLLSKEVDDSFISTNIQGVIAGRIDRLGNDAKRILQEASVIGRAFLFDILQRISEIKQDIDKKLIMLERLDLITAKSIQPSLEYIFKHALTQEIVYNGLVKSERKLIHKKIGDVIETLFKDRLSEFFEPLAYHYTEGEAGFKAVEYLTKSGEKCLRRYSLEESHQYFSKAYEQILIIDSPSKEKHESIIATLNKWAPVFYYRSEFRSFLNIADNHLDTADSIANSALAGKFFGWVGFFIFNARLGKSELAYETLLKAAELSKQSGDGSAIAYSYTWLTWACCELARLDDAEHYGSKALSLSENIENDNYLFFKLRCGLAHLNIIKDNIRKAIELSNAVIAFGRKNSIVRAEVLGYCYLGFSYYAIGNYEKAIETLLIGIKASRDVFYSYYLKFFLGASYVQAGYYKEALNTLEAICEHGRSENGKIITLIPAYAEIFYGAALVAEGEMQKGIDKILSIQDSLKDCDLSFLSLMADCVLGSIFSQIVKSENSIGAKAIFKNIGFLIKNIPGAMKKSEKFLLKTIERGKEIGSTFIVGQASYDLGCVCLSKNKKDTALKYLTDAKKIYKQNNADINLKRIEDTLALLK